NDVNGFRRAARISPVADDVDLRIVTEHCLANVICFLGKANTIDFSAGTGYLASDAAAAGGVGENPVGAAAMIVGADFFHPLDHLIDRELLRGELIRLPLSFRVSERGRRAVVPDTAR